MNTASSFPGSRAAQRAGVLLAIGMALQACSLMPREGGSSAPVVTSPAKPETRPQPRPEARPEVSPPARPEVAKPGVPERSTPGVISDRKIDLAGSCTQTEEDGDREQATLTVRDNQVQSMAWQLWVGKKGTCKFDFADFVQTKTRPSIELASRNGSACKLVIYQDPRRVTLGFANCQKHCTGPVYDEAYPVMFDPKTGACADLDR